MEYNIQKLIRATKQISDPRRQWGNLRHNLSDVLVIAFCAIICGAQSYEDLELFGKAREAWLSWFLPLPHSIPSADTFERVFEVLDPQIIAKKLRKIFTDSEMQGKIVAFDGKTIRGSKDADHRAFHVVSAFLTNDQTVIGEEIVDEKSNEITAIPKLLDELNVKGATVTIDAMGTQTKIAEKIVQKGANYVLALKGNQSDLHDDVRFYFENESNISNKVTCEIGHGREEKREYFLETNIEWLHNRDKWVGLAAIGAVRSTVAKKGKECSETRYFITSLTNIDEFSSAVREHWGIENRLHWHLDVTFGEDASRFRNRNSANVWNVLRKTALEYLKKLDPGKKVSIKSRRKFAGWDNSYLENLLALDLEK
jgi:predicted transposase YbfD/YdcC